MQKRATRTRARVHTHTHTHQAEMSYKDQLYQHQTLIRQLQDQLVAEDHDMPNRHKFFFFS